MDPLIYRNEINPNEWNKANKIRSLKLHTSQIAHAHVQNPELLLLLLFHAWIESVSFASNQSWHTKLPLSMKSTNDRHSLILLYLYRGRAEKSIHEGQHNNEIKLFW